MTEHGGWEAVGAAIRQRMKRLRITQAELARRSGASQPTVRGLMNGTPRGTPSDIKRAEISDALGWSADSIDRILGGGEPELVVTPLRRLPDSDGDAIGDLDRRLSDVEEAVRTATPSLLELGAEVAESRARIEKLEKKLAAELGRRRAQRAGA